MLINAPPAVCGEAFRRDGYCRLESEGVFSKNELGRSIIKARKIRHGIGNSTILLPFETVYYF